ncbi:GNAT family N-acetyltransferase [Adonisia turfae]|uniref:GNAT family N-acetyltransferase n=1 Tax=Adonisia turfae TaxID=2950184 RepID=UPI0032B57DF7
MDNLVFSDESYSFLTLRQLYDVCGDFFVVAKKSESEIVGYTIGCPKANTLDSWILALAIDPRYRHQGIGRRLTSYLLSQLKEIKTNYVFLTVDPQNTIAINLYSDLGFEFVAYKEDYFGKKSARNIMKKKLL